MVFSFLTEDALLDFEGTLLFVSHDRYFINRIATKVIEISETGSTLYLGDYDYYLTKKAELESMSEDIPHDLPVIHSAGAQDYQEQKTTQKERRKLTRQLEDIEPQLETIEQTIKELNQTMLVTNDTSELMRLQSELERLTLEQDELMLSWEDISEQLEN